MISPGEPAFTQLLGINNGVPLPAILATVVSNNGFTLTLPSTYAPENFSGSVQTQVVGTFTGINFAGKMSAQALGLNNDGEIVGSFMDAAGNTRGFLFNIATATYQQVDDPHAVGPGGTVISGLNDNGQIVGFTDASGNVNGLVGTATTPEPASLLLLGTGLLGLTGITKPRSSAAN